MKKIKIKVIGAKDFYIVPDQFFDLKNIIGKKLKPIKVKIIGAKDFYIKSEVFIPEGIPTWLIEIPLWTDAHPHNYNYYSFGEDPYYSYFKRKILYSPKIAIVFSPSDQEELVRNFRSGIPPSPTRSWHFHPRLILKDMTRQVDEQPLNKYQAKIRIYYPSGHKWEKIFRGGIGIDVKVNENDLPLDAFTYNYGTFPKTLVIKVYPWGDFQVWDINDENDTEVWIMSLKVDPELQISSIEWITEPIVISAAWWATNILIEEENFTGSNGGNFYLDFGTHNIDFGWEGNLTKNQTLKVYNSSGYVRVSQVPLSVKIHTFIKSFSLPLKILSSDYLLSSYSPYSGKPSWWETVDPDNTRIGSSSAYVSGIGGTQIFKGVIIRRNMGNRIRVYSWEKHTKYETCMSYQLFPFDINKQYKLYFVPNYFAPNKHLAYVFNMSDGRTRGVKIDENSLTGEMYDIALPGGTASGGYFVIEGEMRRYYLSSGVAVSVFKYDGDKIAYATGLVSDLLGFDSTKSYIFFYKYPSSSPTMKVLTPHTSYFQLVAYDYDLSQIPNLPPDYSPKFSIPNGILFVHSNAYIAFIFDENNNNLLIKRWEFSSNRQGILAAEDVIWGINFNWAICEGVNKKADVYDVSGIKKICFNPGSFPFSTFDNSSNRILVKTSNWSIGIGAFSNWGIRIMGMPSNTYSWPIPSPTESYSLTPTAVNLMTGSVQTQNLSLNSLGIFGWIPTSAPDD
jgi:hypothetical protein